MMGGQISSTFLTLIVVPCFYILITRFSEVLWGIEDDEEPGGGAPAPEGAPR